MSPSKDFDFLYLTPSTRNVPDVMAYSELVSLSACKSYSRTPGSMRKYAVCGSMRELGGARGKYGRVCEACRSWREYAEVCGSMREVSGSVRKYAGSMGEVCGEHGDIYSRLHPAYFPAYLQHTSRILPQTPAYFRILPPAPACFARPSIFPARPTKLPHTPAYRILAHATAESRTLPHTP